MQTHDITRKLIWWASLSLDHSDRRELKETYRSHPLNEIDTHTPLTTDDLVEVRTRGIWGENLISTYENPPVPGAIRHLLVRPGIAKRLHKTDAMLQKAGLRLWICDAWRPREVQAHIMNHSVRSKLRAENPDKSEAELEKMLPNYVAEPEHPSGSPPPHLTGAAVDVTIVKSDGTPLEFGKACTVPADININWPDAFHLKERVEPLTSREQTAKRNRALLTRAMWEHGFEVNPTEFWHFSRGDQMWARLRPRPWAWYGEVRPGVDL